MEKATFKLDNYHFTEAYLDFNISNNVKLSISFIPKGIYRPKEAQYELTFEVVVECNETKNIIVRTSCVALFSFNDKLPIEEIPEYFFPNSLAIVFPYVRAFVSTLTLQANVSPIVLPTVNLMGLTEELKEQTVIEE